MLKVFILSIMALLIGSCQSFDKKLPSIKPTFKYNAIVRLKQKSMSYCTGFVVSKNYALTAAHCVVRRSIFGSHSVDAVDIGNDLGDTIIRAKVVGLNHRVDYALLEGDFSNFRQLEPDFTGERTFTSNQLVACGFPYGSKKIRCSKMQYLGTKYFFLKAIGELIFPGHSGGPVFDAVSKKVIGLNSAVDSTGMLISPIKNLPDAFGLTLRDFE